MSYHENLTPPPRDQDCHSKSLAATPIQEGAFRSTRCNRTLITLAAILLAATLYPPTTVAQETPIAPEAAVPAYATLNALKHQTTLQDGALAYTTGFHTAGDGGGRLIPHLPGEGGS